MLSESKRILYGYYILEIAYASTRQANPYVASFTLGQASTIASQNPEWIVWQDGSGKPCGPPYPPYNYTKPEAYGPHCTWQPLNKKVIGSIDYDSVSYYVSIVNSVIAVVLLLFFVPTADFAYYRKPILFILGYIQAIAFFFTFFLVPDRFYMTNVIITAVGGTVINILYPIINSYIALAAKYHGNFREMVHKITMRGSMIPQTFNLAFFVPLLFILFSIYGNDKTVFEDRLVIMIVAVIFTLLWTISAIMIPNVKGKDVEPGVSPFTLGLRQTIVAAKLFKIFTQLGILFLAQTFIQDANATVSHVSNTIALTLIGLTPEQQLIGNTINLVTMVLSTLFFLYVTKNRFIRPSLLLKLSVIWMISLCIYSYFFLTSLAQHYIIGILNAIGQSAYGPILKSIFASSIPNGYETTFFSFLQMTGGVQGWICPFLTGIINDNMGQIKYAYIILLIPFFLVGFAFLMIFDIKKAAKQKMSERNPSSLNTISPNVTEEEVEFRNKKQLLNDLE